METMTQSGLWSSLGTHQFLPQDVAFSMASPSGEIEVLMALWWLNGGYSAVYT